MAFTIDYRNQVELLIRCLPALASVEQFALKGGTAINLFHQDLPRLSVDIDLTYLPIETRNASLKGIRTGLKTMRESLERSLPGVHITALGTDDAPKLQVRLNKATVKVEPSPILRGTLETPENRVLTPRAESEFGITATARCVSLQDLYAGKLCAALDRQHPRDLFDMMQYCAAKDLDAIRPAFIVYLCCHSRPMSDLLAPRALAIDTVYATHFEGMTEPATSLEALLRTRQALFDWVSQALTDRERAFLLSVKQGVPNYDLAPYSTIEFLPAFQWKLQNIQHMSARKHKTALAKLEATLNL